MGAGNGQLGLSAHLLVVHAFLNSLLYHLLHLERVVVLPAQVFDEVFPFHQLNISKRGVLNDLITAVLAGFSRGLLLSSLSPPEISPARFYNTRFPRRI